MQIATYETEMSIETLRMGLVEASALNRETLSLALSAQPGIEVKLSVGSPDDVSCRREPLDLVLFSCRYPSDIFGEGLTLDYWRLRLLGARIAVLTQTRARAPISTMIEAGVDAYAIQGSIGTLGLVDVLHAAYAGTQALCPVAQDIITNAKEEAHLTLREMQVMRMLHEHSHLSRKQMAGRLQMSYHTMNVHVRNISEKLEVFGVNAMIRCCVELGWLGE